MRPLFIRLGILVLLICLALTSSLWLTPLLNFVTTNSATIQGFSNLIQIVLWVFAGLIALLGLREFRKRREEGAPLASTHESVVVGGDMEGENIVVGSAHIVGKEIESEGDIIGGDKNIAGDEVRGDKTVAGDEVRGDKMDISGDYVSGNKYIIESISPPKPGSAPPVPGLFIGRDEDLQNLKKRLGAISKGAKPSAVQVLTAVRGWPGVGKTTMASALAHDTHIAAAFPDGILWMSLGQKPNLLSEMAAWGRALGTDELLRAPTLKEATAQLTGLLHNKRMLLIVDDVWETEHAAPFQQACGKDCALLITTRESGIAEALAPPDTVYNLPVLTEDYALELLQKLAPEVVKQHPNESRELVSALECLPLALQVAGHMLNSESKMGWGVQELLAELREGAPILEAKAPADRIDLETQTIPTVAVLLQKSTDRLDEQVRECFAYLGAFAPKPATFDLAAMKAVWMVEDSKPIARTLVEHGLLEPVGGRFQMHALLVAHARSLCEE
ncbi:MAG: hypothetical protein CV087_06815 [Candidatus Brocadia sp. WS118]|nr:MAG: hypothetical protein CV087_06815 [Candidatus Brocadia sp. WS118]